MEAKDRLIEKLEQDLAEYDKIFLVWDCGEESGKALSDRVDGSRLDRIWLQNLTAALCNQAAIDRAGKKWLILSAIEKFNVPETVSAVYRQISKEEADFFYQLYHLYEFSNRFLVIARESGYGGLFDLLDTGIISIKEAAEALLR